MNEEHLIFYNIGVALAIGLLIGIERGWKEREAKEGMRVAGVRTYGLIGLLGGVLAVIADKFGALFLGLSFVGLAGVLVAVYIVNINRGREDSGITSLIAGLLTFGFGALAAMGEVAIAVAFAVIVTLLLSYKPLLHHWLSSLEANELRAGIKLLLISVVLLPILPDRGYGPWQSLNPYTIWWMVVLIAAISFVGYFAIKIAGARRGTLYTSLFGGLASSTALTLHFARMSQQRSVEVSMLAMGILLACGTMMPRMLLVASLINPVLFAKLAVPAAVMALLTYLPAIYFWRSHRAVESDAQSPLKNPLELKTAFTFGILLALVMLLGKALRQWFGDAGILTLAAVSGIADVDAITLSLARMSHGDLAISIAVTGIVISAAVNNIVKGTMAASIGGRALGVRVLLPLVIAAGGGLVAIWLWVW
jgi:uncharacterized membrane protein (DUF4010 family)